MSFLHVAPVHGAAGIQDLGIEFAPRRGGAGQSPRHQPLGKAAAWRCIEDLNRRHVMDVDLIVSKRHLDATNTQQFHKDGAAGSLHSDRRRPDMPSVLKYETIEYTLRRCKSAPPQQVLCAQNEIVNHVRAHHAASQIGRVTPRVRAKSQQVTLKEEAENQSVQRTPPRTPRTRTRKSKSPRVPKQLRCSPSKELFSPVVGCRTPREEIIMTPSASGGTPREEEACHTKRDELGSTMSTTASTQSILTPLALTNADYSSSVIESVPGSARINNNSSFCRMLDRRMGRLYEEQIQRMVKAQQKKSMKRVS